MVKKAIPRLAPLAWDDKLQKMGDFPHLDHLGAKR